VEPNNLYPLFQPFSQFVSRLPLATQNSWVRAEAVTSVSSVEGMEYGGGGGTQPVVAVGAGPVSHMVLPAPGSTVPREEWGAGGSAWLY